MVEMEPFVEIRDGLGLEDRIAENGIVVNQIQQEGALVVAANGGQNEELNGDNHSANESGNRLAGLLPSAKRKEMGRPTTSMEKVPYEGLSTRFCMICRRQGHKRTTCPGAQIRQKWANPYFKGVFCAKMTRIQRSESATHMLKNYMPPGCPMHMFVQKYMRLQFDTEAEENYEEKQTRIGRPLMWANLAIERHASKIYTRAMFEQFGHILYECGAYQVEVIEKHKTYEAIHSEGEKREKWCRVSYKVTMLDGGEEFDCEYGQFAHMGLLCSHVLMVLKKFRPSIL